MHTQYNAKLSASAELEIRVDIVLRDTMTGTNVAVLDTKYNDVAESSMSDIQQAAFYANEMSVARAFLVYPSTGTKPMWVRNGDVTIQTLVFDLGLPPEEAGQVFLHEDDWQPAAAEALAHGSSELNFVISRDARTVSISRIRSGPAAMADHGSPRAPSPRARR